jgi:hypothetical protein
MNTPQRPLEIFRHLHKRRFKRRPPPDQYIIMAGAHPSAPRKPDDFTQPAAHAVSLDGFADFLRYGKADAGWAIVAALAYL